MVVCNAVSVVGGFENAQGVYICVTKSKCGANYSVTAHHGKNGPPKLVPPGTNFVDKYGPCGTYFYYPPEKFGPPLATPICMGPL